MVRYIDGKFNEDYIQTLGINFLEKKIEQKNCDITYMIWDVGILLNKKRWSKRVHASFGFGV
jgi:GTPase SAR1 family protein